MLLFKNQTYYLQRYIAINMFSLMVFGSWNIFGKQQKGGSELPFLPTWWTLYLKENNG